MHSRKSKIKLIGANALLSKGMKNFDK